MNSSLKKMSKILCPFKQWLIGTKSVLVSFKYSARQFFQVDRKAVLEMEMPDMQQYGCSQDSNASSVSSVSTLLSTALK